MYAREVDVTRLRKRALLGNGRLQQYPDEVFYRVGSQAISRELRRVQLVEFGKFQESSELSLEILRDIEVGDF
jgi:hypothetical protein